jgi:hypothetical protein
VSKKEQSLCKYCIGGACPLCEDYSELMLNPPNVGKLFKYFNDRIVELEKAIQHDHHYTT